MEEKVNRILYPQLNFNIKFLNLPNKIYYTFLEENKVYAADICNITYDEIIRIKGVGKNSYSKTINAINSKCYLYELDSGIKNIINELLELDIDKDSLLIEINLMLKNYTINDRSEFILLLYQNKVILSIFDRYLLDIISKKIVFHSEISKYFPKHLQNKDYINKTVNNLLKQKKIQINQNIIEIKYPNSIEFANTIKDERDKKILIKRFNGQTLEEIGNEYSLTRERIRQILNKYLSKAEVLYEDKYMYLFTNYIIKKDEFLYAFNEEEYVYNYLVNKYNMGHKEINDSLEDKNISEKDKKLLEKIIYRNYIQLDEKKIKMTKDDLLKYVIKKYASNGIEIEELIRIYNKTLNHESLRDIKSHYLLTNKVFFNKVINLNYIVYSMGKRLRYYEMDEKDFRKLLYELKIEKEENVRISTIKLFNENEKLMKLYDIRNGYELHNLLKKIYGKKNKQNVKFSRMPYIIVLGD